MKTREENAKRIPSPGQLGPDPEPLGYRFEFLCPSPRRLPLRRAPRTHDLTVARRAA